MDRWIDPTINGADNGRFGHRFLHDFATLHTLAALMLNDGGPNFNSLQIN